MLSDGYVEQIEDEGGKIFIGPGILFGAGARLVGIAFDNISIEEVRVRDKESGQIWSTKSSGSVGEKAFDGWQSWSLYLTGIKKGERSIEITAYDRVSLTAQQNIGPQTVRQLTLLVDTEPPIVKGIRIERHEGIYAELYPRSALEGLNNANFDHIDYFQNESFAIRADISHDYSVSEVRLNFIDDWGRKLFAGDGLPNESANVYTPYWEIESSDFTNFDSRFATGKHYFKVSITARAQAGHTNNDLITNNLYNLCWYPEADTPHIQSDSATSTGVISQNVNTVVPLQIYDDDDIEAVYHAIVTADIWQNYTFAGAGASDTQKLNFLMASDANRGQVTGLGANKITTSSTRNRNIILTPDAGTVAGTYRLIVLARDKKKDSIPGTGVMTGRVYTLNLTEQGVPPCDLISVICDNPDGAYPGGQILNFKLVFSDMVYTTGAVSITIQGGANGNIGTPKTINMTSITETYADYYLTAQYTIEPGLVFDPVIITAVNISNVKRKTRGDTAGGNLTNVMNAFNTNRAIKIMSIRPYVTAINGTAGTGDPIVLPNNTVLAPASTTRSNLTLTFSHDVWPENGTITIRPADGWYIPPVLSNEDFNKVLAAVNDAQKTTMNNNYTRTTHGLRKDSSGAYYNITYTDTLGTSRTTTLPDTNTKFVLNFTTGISGATSPVSDIRTVLNAAKYNWQEIDVTNVTRSGNTITVPLDRLPDGRLWKIEIRGPAGDEGAFRDEAGNTFAGWGTASNYTFWSSKTAEPVIRVERVTNNHPTTNPTTNTVSGTKGTSSEVTSRVNVRFRIDCETPDAEISYGTLTSKVATITTAMNDGSPTTVYRASSTDGSQNSNLLDATLAELTGITIDQTDITALGGGIAANPIGDISLYTARKDYIAATAARTATPALAVSDRGYEGAFKTLIVYRNVGTRPQSGDDPYWGGVGDRWLRIEGVDVLNGGTVTAGFPMTNNDMTGATSKYVYRNGSSVTDDWIWISWEIVVNFWHVAMTVTSNVPNSALNRGEDPWQTFNTDWYAHNFRKYGNYGLRVGNR
jgi:hypothetical protein